MNGYIIMCFSKGIFMCGYLYSLGPQEGKQQHNSTDIKKIAEENRIIFCERTLDKNEYTMCYNQTFQHWESLDQSIKCHWSQVPHLNIRSSCLCSCVCMCMCVHIEAAGVHHSVTFYNYSLRIYCNYNCSGEIQVYQKNWLQEVYSVMEEIPQK